MIMAPFAWAFPWPCAWAWLKTVSSFLDFSPELRFNLLLIYDCICMQS